MIFLVLKIRKKPIIKFFSDRQRTTILKNLETAEILQEQKENFSLLQVREARDYFSKELEDVINVSECESHPWSNIQFWSSFHRKRYPRTKIGPVQERTRSCTGLVPSWTGTKISRTGIYQTLATRAKIKLEILLPIRPRTWRSVVPFI